MTKITPLIERDDTIDAVAKTTTDVSDVMRGYATMLERAEDDLAPVVERLHTLHATHLGILKSQLRALGGDTSDIGSAMGLVHQSVATVRDWVGALDMSALPQILDGEEMIVETYTEALDTAVAHPGLQAVLTDQRAALRAQISALRS